MPSFFDRFRRDGAAKSKKRFETVDIVQPQRLKWEEAWTRTVVQPEEVQKLIHVCTQEMKSRALDMPFLLLPFRPGLDPIGSKNFVRQYFRVKYEENESITDSKRSEAFARRELRLMEPIVLCSIMKWCWARLPGGVVTWETYDLFKVAESDSKMSKTAFDVFIPLSTESEARKEIIYDFFDLLAAVSARAKTNGLGGRKLSRFAGWWAFEHSDAGKGFDGGYGSWSNAANATSHLFFAYLRSLAPEQTNAVNGISKLPRSLQALLSQSEYPPEAPSLMRSSTTKVIMIVQEVSPTPFALLRRARNFEYRDDDRALQEFSSLEDPIRALTDECRRVLTCISTTNQSSLPGDNNDVQDPSWSRFEDMGFASVSDSLHSTGDLAKPRNGRRAHPRDFDDLNRPQTPSWADFLSSGFADDRSPTLLPPDKQLPLPVPGPRAHSSQSHRPLGEQADLEPGELASITRFDLDETFWWVWMTSLASEEPAERKSVFGRCALIETNIRGAPWLLIEEQVKGASPGQEEGVYLAEKKGLFSFTKRGRLSRKKTTKKTKALEETKDFQSTISLNRISPEKHERLHAAAKRLAKGDHQNGVENSVQKRSRLGHDAATKTTSSITVGNFMNEAGAALKWTNNYDSGGNKGDAKVDARSHYLSDPIAGTGKSTVPILSSSAIDLSRNAEYGTSKITASTKNLPVVLNESPSATRHPKPSSPPRTPPKSHGRKDSETTQFLPDEKIAPTEEHPALRNDSVGSPASPHVIGTSPVQARRSSPKQEHKRLQKKEPAAQTGLKKLFGRKKTTEDRADSTVQKMTESVEEKPKPKAPASKPIIIPDYAKAQAPAPEPVKILDSPPRSIHNEPVFNAPLVDETETNTAARDEARRAALDRLQAEDEFSRFDQGPMSDMPSVAPADDADDDDDDDDNDAAPPPVIKTHAKNTRAGGLLQPDAGYPAPRSVSPARKPMGPQMRFPVRTADAPAGAQSSATSDRWAQIRKNAAERAARLNGEQQQQQAKQHGRNQSTSARSDDGETSGEETIESRVARIKARVAELTGNMDPAAAPARVH